MIKYFEELDKAEYTKDVGMLQKLSKSESYQIRFVVARNSYTPKSVLVELANDKIFIVRSIARRKLKE